MEGRKELKEQSLAIQSVCSFYIYVNACEILKFNTREERRKALANLPERIRPHIQAEAEQLWRARNVNLRMADDLRELVDPDDRGDDL